MTARVLLIGLDSADALLIERWAEQGHLPCLAALRRDGLWSRLGTTAEIMHVSAWPTIYTGVTPGRHGLYHAYQVRAGDQRIHRAEPTWLARPPFWKHLDDAGRRCIVLDAFMDAPLPGFRGLHLLEYGTWTWFGAPGSSPVGLRDEILRRFGPYPGPEHMEVTSVPADLRAFRDRLVAGAARKAEVTCALLREHPWDFLFVTFGEPHGAGHYLWHAEDAGYPSHPPGGVPGMPSPVRDVYAAVDRAIARILEAAGDGITVLVVSGDGMGPNYSGCHHVPPLLARMGLHRPQGGGSPGLLKRLRGLVPLPLRQAVSRCLPKARQHQMALSWMNSGTDWPGTRAYMIPNSNEAYLRLNLSGREPHGIVAAGERDELLARLRAEMEGLVNPDSGAAAAERVTVIDDVFPGSERPHLPDLVVSWREAARVLGALEGPTAGRVAGRAGHEISPFYTGNHRPLAFVAGRGPQVRAGARLEHGHILDIPATVLALLDVVPPAHLEGRAWGELLPGAVTPAAVA